MTDTLFDPAPEPEPEPVTYPRDMVCVTPIKAGKRRRCGHPYYAHWGKGGTCVRGLEGTTGSVCPCLRFTPPR